MKKLLSLLILVSLATQVEAVQTRNSKRKRTQTTKQAKPARKATKKRAAASQQAKQPEVAVEVAQEARVESLEGRTGAVEERYANNSLANRARRVILKARKRVAAHLAPYLNAQTRNRALAATAATGLAAAYAANTVCAGNEAAHSICGQIGYMG